MSTKIAQSVVGKLAAAKLPFDPSLILGIITAIFSAFKICNPGPSPTPAQARSRVLKGQKKNGNYKPEVLNPATKAVLEKWQETGERSGFKRKRNRRDAEVIAAAHLDAIAEASDADIQEEMDAA